MPQTEMGSVINIAHPNVISDSLLITSGILTSARHSPSKIALQEQERRLTYSLLAERINRVGNAALGIGLAPGDRAALMAPNCIEFVEISCGLAAAGIPVVMIHSRATLAEMAAICADAEARILFVDPAYEELAQAANCPSVERIIVIGADYEAWLASARGDQTESRVSEYATFSIPYTSGTTDRPKGVALSHRSRVLTFFAMNVVFGCYTSADHAVAVSPLYHGGGFTFGVAPLFFGGTCTLIRQFEPEHLLAEIQRTSATNVFLVPTHFNSIFKLEEKEFRRFDVSSLKAIISNAAPLPQATKEKIAARFGPRLLFEVYGSTEASMVTYLRPEEQLVKEECAGRPFPCTNVKLVTEDDRDAGVGEIGELFSRSPYLFNGYWKRPELTAAAVRDGWFSARDLARMDEDGYFYIVDRIDDKIVSGGVNIYPREIEEVLRRHPAVSDVAVFGIPDSHWGEAVHAAVVTRPSASVDPDQLRQYCYEHLARYKSPKSIEFISAIPTGPSGKTLRRALRNRYWEGKSRKV